MFEQHHFEIIAQQARAGRDIDGAAVIPHAADQDEVRTVVDRAPRQFARMMRLCGGNPFGCEPAAGL